MAKLPTNVISDLVAGKSKKKKNISSNPIHGSVVSQVVAGNGKGKSNSDKQKDNDSGNSTSGSKDPNSIAGIAFGGHMSAEIIRDVVNLFILNTTFSPSLSVDSDETDNDKNGNADSDKVAQGSGYDAYGHQTGAVSELLYKYQLGNSGTYQTVKDILKVAIPADAKSYISAGLNSYQQISDESGHWGEVFNPDESMIPSPPQFLGYNGSILSMVNDLSNRPFNELYFTHEEGQATLHYRVTPFEESDWFALPKVVITANELLSKDVSLSDQEQYSIFKLTSSNSQSNADANKFVLPVTDNKEELIGRYGYKTLEKETQYFDTPVTDSEDGAGSESSATDEDKAIYATQDKTDDKQSSKNYPLYSTVIAYADMQKLKSDSAKKKWAETAPIDNYYGGNGLYDVITQTASQTNITAKQKAINIYNNAQQYCNTHGVTNNPVTSSDSATLANLSTTGQLNKYTYMTTVIPDKDLPFIKQQSGQSQLSGYLSTDKGRREHPNKAAADLYTLSGGNIGTAQAKQLVEAWVQDGTLSYADYNYIMNHVPHSEVNADVAKQVGQDGGKTNAQDINATYMRYQKKLFNWYADDSKYYSGEIKVIGKAGIEFGKRLYFNDDKTPNSLWEFYIESVSHEFDYQSGWTTTIGVTRGLKVSYIGDTRRFSLFWGQSQEFAGGFFGEPKIRDALSAAIASSQSSSDGDSDSGDSDGSGPSVKGSKAAMGALKIAKKYANKGGIWSLGYHGLDFTETNPPKGDCSSFVYFCYKHAGFNWGVSYPLTTGGISSSSKVTTIGSSGDNKDSVWKKLKKGDMVFWDTDGRDGHIGIYSGGGNCIAFNTNGGIQEFNASSNSGYWWNHFSGHVVRAK